MQLELVNNRILYYNINSCMNAQVFIIVNHETNSIAVLPRLYVLISANILPKRYNGTNILVAKSTNPIDMDDSIELVASKIF